MNGEEQTPPPPDESGDASAYRRPENPEAADVGSVADEAAKLFGALSEWARDQGTEWSHGVAGLAGAAAAGAYQAAEHLSDGIDTGAPECRYCPVCRTVHVVRELSPEVRDHLASAASSLMQAAAGVLAASGRQHRDGRPAPSVERIDLDDDWPEEE